MNEMTSEKELTSYGIYSCVTFIGYFALYYLAPILFLLSVLIRFSLIVFGIGIWAGALALKNDRRFKALGWIGLILNALMFLLFLGMYAGSDECMKLLRPLLPSFEISH